MSLNKQLLCIGLILLSLPWAGCQYLREMDAALKQGQQQSLAAATAIIARSLALSPEQLDPHGEIVNEATPEAIYCHPLTIPVRVDGYFEEWTNEEFSVPWDTYSGSVEGRDGSTKAASLRYRCGIFGEQLSMAFAVEDDDVIYNNPSVSLIGNGDRLLLATGMREYTLTAVAPGSITPRYLLNPHTTYRDSSIDAAWVDSDKGYQVELTMPLAWANARLGFSIIDESSKGQFQYGPGNNTFPPPRFVYQAEAVKHSLETFKQEGLRLTLLNPAGFKTAVVGNPEVKTVDSAHWLLRKLYRSILEAAGNQYPSQGQAVNLSLRPEVTSALHGAAAGQWYRDANRSDYLIVSAAEPIYQGDRLQAILLAEQSSEQTAALTDRVFSRLFSLSFVVFALAVVLLLMYASWLSWRIRRLSAAAESALQDRNYRFTDFPNSQSRDEIGTLTRNYSELMRRIAEYTEYLQNLSQKLSHELRTPLAIIHSSLDNLAAQRLGEQGLDGQDLDDSSLRYQQRAKEGAQRLGTILTAMSEARRVEESIEQADLERLPVQSFLAEVLEAYRDIYPERCIVTDLPTVNEVELLASADLLVQMLDKLMDNANDFCPVNGEIMLSLLTEAGRVQIKLSNDGPLLPQAMQSQLFDNMVSLREASEDSSHLGLGLHIVKIIVNYHQGTVQARNRDDGTGVEFIIWLPIASRE